MANRRSTREKILTLLQDHTQAEVAKRLRVSTRTIRRWKNDGVNPVAHNAKRLSNAVSRTISQIKKMDSEYGVVYKKTGKVLRKPIPTVNLPIQLIGRRRVMHDIVTGEPRLSENVFFLVDKLSEKDIHNFLKTIRDSGKYDAYMLIGIVPYGGTSPEGSQLSVGDRFGHVPEQFFYKQKGRIQKISDIDIAQKLDYVLRHNAQGNIRVIEEIQLIPRIKIKRGGKKPIKRK